MPVPNIRSETDEIDRDIRALHVHFSCDEDFSSSGSLVALTCGAKEGKGAGFGT